MSNVKKIYDDEFIRLNNVRISNASVDEIKRMLVDRTSNLEHSNFSMDYTRLVTITAIDHFVCKQILDGASLSSLMVAYFEELDKQLMRQPLLFLSLPIRDIDVNILRKYLPNIDNVINACKKKKSEAILVNNKLKKGEAISKNEVFTLVKYFSYSCVRDTDNNIIEAQDRFVKYLMSNFDSFGLMSASFIMRYFGYKKCRELGLEGIQILVGDLSSYSDLVYGMSWVKTITLSKKHLVGTSFKNNTISSEFKKLSTGQLEGLIILKNLYHEIRHAYQDKEHFESKTTDVSYMMSVRKIIAEIDSKEYDRNYRNYNIEADANQYGWRWSCDILKNYMGLSKSDRCSVYSDIYRAEHFLKKSFASKIDKNGSRRFIGLFEKENLDEYFKRYPEKLKNEFSHFLKFYNVDGTPKGLNELIRFKSHSSVDFQNFYLSQVSARMVSGESFDYQLFDKLNIEEKKNIIINLHSLIYSIYDKFSVLKTQLSSGAYLLDNMENVDHNAIKYNVIRYFKLVVMYSKELSIFINRYPDLMNYGADYYLNGPTNVNIFINHINKNEIVQRLVGDKKIDLVEVPDVVVKGRCK